MLNLLASRHHLLIFIFFNFKLVHGSHPTSKNLENMEFCLLFFQACKMSGICFKMWEKDEILTQNLDKPGICKFGISRFTFQDVILKKLSFYI